MSRPRPDPLPATALALLLAGCAAPPADWAEVREVTPARFADLDAADPAVAADRSGRVALTWVTRDSLGHDLWLALSSDSGLTFSAPVRVNPSPGGVASDAENRPLAAFGEGGELLVAWSQRRADSLPASDLVVRASGDGGRTLGPATVVNDDAADGRPGHHRLPALAALPGGGWFATWMDPREHGPEDAAAAVASLFHARSGDGGRTWSANRPLAASACAGCRPAVAADRAGRLAVAYRSAWLDVRDPALAVSLDGGLGVAYDTLIAEDGWRVSGCPVEGPALTLGEDGSGHYAWTTGAAGGGAWVVPWRVGGGASGVPRPLSDSTIAPRRPRLARLGAGTLIAVEGPLRDDPARTVVAVRMLDPGGALTPWLFLGADARAPWPAATGGRTALVVWSERDERGDRLRLVRLVRRAR